jgi:hypothetical protein
MFFGRGFDSRRLHLKNNISSELSFQNRIFMHPGAGGIYANEGHSMTVNGNGSSNFQGIHFHHSEPLTVIKSTALLRLKGLIRDNESVVELRSCGTDNRGVEGFAARTDKMFDSYEPHVSLGDLFDSINTLRNSSLWPKK